MTSGSEISEKLRAELEEATRLHEEAKRNFWRVSAELPGGLVDAEGIRRMQDAARVQTGAMKALAVTLRRVNAYLMDGIVPDDLKKE